MKKLAIPILLLALVLAGCARQINTRIPPLSYIDSVSAAQVYVGQSIKFSGHGISSIGEIVAYNWRSNINGDLSKQASFETSTLSAGAHTVWFKVQDNYGNWSNEVGTNVNVLAQGGPTAMTIKVFTATPASINPGDEAILTWDVSGLGNVRIDPDIGDVALNGSRVVKPYQDTLYTIYATNNVGIAKATTQVLVSSLQLSKATLYSIDAEDNTIKNGNIVSTRVMVGEDEKNLAMQGVLSFDITSLPLNATIKTVELDLTRTKIINQPFPYQGDLQIYNLKYGLEYDTYGKVVMLPSPYLYKYSTNATLAEMPVQPFVSSDMTAAVQRQLDSHNSRFQVRIQFEKYYYYNLWGQEYNPSKTTIYTNAGNYMDVSAGNPSLVVYYTVPK